MNKTILIIILVLVVVALALGVFFYAYKEDAKPIFYKDVIRVDLPLSDSVVQSPLKVTGSARGIWYFEASFPVKIFDSNGKELGVVPAQAQGDWMTADFVPFEANITFQTPTTETGTLVLEKDNPSGLPENSDSVTIPVRFQR